jgi:hypothetical protein
VLIHGLAGELSGPLCEADEVHTAVRKGPNLGRRYEKPGELPPELQHGTYSVNLMMMMMMQQSGSISSNCTGRPLWEQQTCVVQKTLTEQLVSFETYFA